MHDSAAFSNSQSDEYTETESESTDYNNGALEVDILDVPTELFSLNRPVSHVSILQKRGPSSSTSEHRSQDDVIITSTPLPAVTSQGRQHSHNSHAGHLGDQRPRSHRNSLQRREFSVREDQTAIPYHGRRSERSMRRKARATAQPSSQQEVAEPLHDITNNTPRQRAPASRKRGQKTGQWTNEQLSKAIEAVEGGMRLYSASELYKIPPSLRDHLYGITLGRKRGGKAVLTPAEEEQIVQWITRLQDLGHPISMTALRMKVADICQERETPFVDGIPGRGWLRWWRRQHPELSLRVAQGLEISRARGLCPETVATFYENLQQLYEQHSYSPNSVWNCDESGVQAGRNGGALVIARKGTRSVKQVVPDEREWLSVLACINAAGHSIPSFYIFKGKRFRKNYIAKCESGATMAMQPRAWMTSFLFSSWLSHFVKCLENFGGVSQEKRHLLILDGHSSHVSLDAVEIARKQGIDLLSLPSHTSHAMQPLDVCLFKPFKDAFKAYRDFWTYRSGGAPAKKQHLAQWVSLALQKALTTQNIQKGFAVTGIWPLNSDAMAGKMGPSEIYSNSQYVVGEDQGESTTLLSISEIHDEVSLPKNPEARHYYVNVEGDGGDSAGEGGTGDVHNDFAVGEELSSVNRVVPGVDFATEEDLECPNRSVHGVDFATGEELACPNRSMHGIHFEAGEEPACLNKPVPSISKFLTLPQVGIQKRSKRAEVLIDYSKSIILTSDEYLASMEEKLAKKEALLKSKEEKKKQKDMEKQRRQEEKAREEQNKRQREEEKRLKKAFDLAWSPASISAYGQRLHDRIRSRQPPPPNSFAPPFCGFLPRICIENQQIAIQRRRAKRRKEDRTLIPPLTTPDWAHRPGNPLWSRLLPHQARLEEACTAAASSHVDNPSSMHPMLDWLRRPDIASRMFLRPFHQAESPPFQLPLSSEAQPRTSNIQLGSPVIGVVRPSPQIRNTQIEVCASELSTRPAHYHDEVNSDSLGFSFAT